MKFYFLVGKAKDGWNKFIKVIGTNIYIAVDNDKAGEQMREKYAGVLFQRTRTGMMICVRWIGREIRKWSCNLKLESLIMI